MTGYSGKSLIEKLGIKPKDSIKIVNAPQEYEKVIGEVGKGPAPYTFIQIFTKQKKELEKKFHLLRDQLIQNGMLWVSWPKGSSKVQTDLNENIVREIGLLNGMVDVKVAAIDEVWSGLKFVFRVKDRK